MIKSPTLFVLLILLVAGIWCWQQYMPTGFDLKTHLRKYNRLKQEVKHHHDSLKTSYKQFSKARKSEIINHSQAYLQQTLSQKIFPYWYGTRWNYHGTSNNPRKGKIACGYFVTTTLKHAGFNLNRHKLAQQAASIIIKRLCKPGSITTIGQNETERLIEYLRKQPDGLYILGLDTHVGFIEKYQNKLDFIHASYSTQKSVARERAINSRIISNSSIYMIGNLLDNKRLIRQWLLGQKIRLKAG